MRSARFVLAAFLAGTVAGSLLAAETGERSLPSKERRDSDGPEEILERIRLYLRQHGDHGRIDPERRLRAARGEYQRRRSDRVGRRPESIGGTRWLSIGPTNGAGRMTAIAPHPTLAGTIYAGAADGGVWKTADGGATWEPLTDDIPDLSVGALAVAPSSPDVLYLGSGEGGYAVDFVPGIGLLRSGDGGKTWELPASVIASTFYRISVHPTNPLDLVAGTNQGGIRSTDGGRTWTTVIPRGQYGDVTEVLRDPGNPQVLYAATWGIFSATQSASRVLKSTDGGATWTSKSLGLPPIQTGADRFQNRLALALSPSTTTVLYAATALDDGADGNFVSHVYKTTDGGDSWADLPAVSGNARPQVKGFLGGQSWYGNALVVSPADPNTLIAGGIGYIRTTDGGETFAPAADFVHVDVHDLRYQDATLYVANDGGVWSSSDGGVTFQDRNLGLVTRQYYALGNDLSHRNRVVAGSQDNGTGLRPDSGGTEWMPFLGGDGFECAVSSLAPDLIYGSIQNGFLLRSKDSGLTGSDITPRFDPDEDTPFHTVLAVAPGRPTTLYTGSTRVWRSVDAGDTWVPLPTAVDQGSWNTATVTSLVAAPSDGHVLWVAKGAAGYRSTDGGEHWRRADSGLPSVGVNRLEVDARDASVAYAALSTTVGPSVYRTSDGGAHWEARAGGLPSFAALVVRIDPSDPEVLFCGTDVGVYRSADQGRSWSRFGTDLPAVSVQDLRISEDSSLVRIATHGRGAWELEIPASGNRAPAAGVVSPGGSATVARDTAVLFKARLSDPDAGDSVSGVWLFPDTWETAVVGGGDSTVTHVFHQSGVFRVALTARDRAGATSASVATVSVSDPADDCHHAIVLSGAGPFPETVFVNNELATRQASDPAPSCISVEGFGVFSSVWLDFTPEVSGSYEISTCGTGEDTVLSAFTGPACGPYTEVADGCNDDAASGDFCPLPASRITIAAAGGETIRIQVTAYDTPEDEGLALGIVPVTVARVGDPTGPRATGISPPVGPSTGGMRLVIYGSNFASGASLSIGGAPASDVEVFGSSVMSAVAPPHVAGSADVVIQNPDGTSGRLLAAYTYFDVAKEAPVVPCAQGGPGCSDRRDPRVVPFRD